MSASVPFQILFLAFGLSLLSKRSYLLLEIPLLCKRCVLQSRLFRIFFSNDFPLISCCLYSFISIYQCFGCFVGKLSQVFQYLPLVTNRDQIRRIETLKRLIENKYVSNRIAVARRLGQIRSIVYDDSLCNTTRKLYGTCEFTNVSFRQIYHWTFSEKTKQFYRGWNCFAFFVLYFGIPSYLMYLYRYTLKSLNVNFRVFMERSSK